MKLDPDRKLFLGLKLEPEMRREVESGKLAVRPAFKPGDPAHLEMVDVQGDLYMGRVVDAGLSVDALEDLKRNIKSIITVTFPNQRAQGPIRIFALDRPDVAPGFAAAS